MGSNDLKRVGLIFTEEGAKDFKKTLQDINIEMNKNYNQFKLTQSQWDNSTKSTEKLKAQQEYLTNAYEIQSDKVNVLKMQLADLENAENKNTTAIKKKQNELTNAEIKLKNYESKLKDVQTQLTNTGKKLEEWGEKVEKSGKKIEDAGKKLSAFSAASISALTLSAKSAIDFEDAFAGVEKTVDGTKEQMEELKQGIRDMAKEIPSSTTEIAAVAEAAGQLGIKTENILDFSKAMIDLGNSTNLTADEAASQLAKFANITQMSQKDFDKLGSTIVDLGNKYATTEADIVSMAMRLAGAGKQVGFSEAEILGLATALSSVGIEAEMGGSAISKAMVKMQNAVEQGGKKLDTVLKKTGMTLRELELMSANDSMGFKELSQSIGMTSTELKQLITAGTNLEDFAKVSGMTTEQFKKAWKEDAAGALSEFIKGLGDAENKGESAITMLSEMGLTEVRLRDSLLRAANAGTLFNDAINTGTQAWKNNTALTNEANKRYDTLKSKIKIAVNKLKDMAITLGNKLMPSIEKILDKFGKWIEKFESLSDEQVDMIVKLGLFVAAIGPVLTVLGKLTSTIGGTIKGIGTFVQAIGVAKGTITSTSTAVNGLANVLTSLSNPALLAVTAITAVTTAVGYFALKQIEASQEIKEFADNMKNAKEILVSYNEGIDKNTKANLSNLNSVANLKDELFRLVDANGKVEDKYKSRVEFILKELNSALGTEYKLNGNLIEGYKNLQGEIDTLIKKKKAEIQLSADEEKYKNAIANQEQAVSDLKTAYENLQTTQEKYGMNLDELRVKAQEYYDMANNQAVTGGSSFAKKAWENNAEAIQKVIDAYDDAEYRVKTFTEEVQTYTDNYQLYVEGKYEEIGNTIRKNTHQWSDESIETIKDTITETSNNLEIYKKIYETTGNEIAKKEIEQGEKRLSELKNELDTRTSAVTNKRDEETKAWKDTAEEGVFAYSTELSKLKRTTENKIQDATDAINNNTSVEKATKDLAKDAERGFNDNVDGATWGSDLSKEISSSMTNKKSKNWIVSAASTVAGWISSYLHFSLPEKGPLSDMDESMPDMIDLMAKGIDKNKSKVIKSAKNMANDINNEVGNINRNVSLNGNTSYSNGNIDYQKMADAFSKALTGCKFTLEEDGFARIVKDELYKAV